MKKQNFLSRPLYLIFFLIPFCLNSCSNFPKDPENTSEKAKETLRVGIIEHPPFTYAADQQYSGIEVELVKNFAAQSGYDIQWINAPEEVVMEMLKNYELHMAVGGFTTKSPYKKEIGFTKAYLKKEKKKYVMAVAPGENAFLLRLEKFLSSQKSKTQ